MWRSLGIVTRLHVSSHGVRLDSAKKLAKGSNDADDSFVPLKTESFSLA
jgi:hypothetical protein